MALELITGKTVGLHQQFMTISGDTLNVRHNDNRKIKVTTSDRETTPAGDTTHLVVSRALPPKNGRYFVLGRDEACDIVIGTRRQGVSRKHCYIYYNKFERKLIIHDVSTHGSFLALGEGANIKSGVRNWRFPLEDNIKGTIIIERLVTLRFEVADHSDHREWWERHLSSLGIPATIAMETENVQASSALFPESDFEKALDIWYQSAEPATSVGNSYANTCANSYANSYVATPIARASTYSYNPMSPTGAHAGSPTAECNQTSSLIPTLAIVDTFAEPSSTSDDFTGVRALNVATSAATDSNVASIWTGQQILPYKGRKYAYGPLKDDKQLITLKGREIGYKSGCSFTIRGITADALSRGTTRILSSIYGVH